MRMRILCSGLLALMAVVRLSAVSTEVWRQSTRAEFEKGTRTGIALSHDGRLTLAPTMKELKDSSLPYLWTVVEDNRGVIYFAGAGTSNGKAAVHELSADGKHKVLAELDAFQVQALATSADGRLYAATSPDGKIYRIESNGSAKEFYDPKSKYIWSLAVDNSGTVFAGTGEKGEVHRISPDGKGAVYFETDEKHARSLAIDKQGKLIVGTEPSGLVFRVNAANQGFVLHQCSRSEVTSIAVGPDNRIVVSAMGSRGRISGPSLPAPPTSTPLPDPAKPPAGTSSTAARSAAPPSPISFPATSGGGEVWAILPDGEPKLLWEDGKESIYSIAIDQQNRVIAATGGQGNLYRIESPISWSLLGNLNASQVTGLTMGRSGRVLAVTASTGRLYEIGPGLASEGTFESDVYDAEAFVLWGRALVNGQAAGATVTVATRSGNMDRAQKNWSSWQEITLDQAGVGVGGRALSPAARFVQYKLTLKGTLPEVTSFELAFRAKNISPTIRAVEATPANYRFPAPTPQATATRTLTLPPIGQTRVAGLSPVSLDGSPSLTYAKGMRGVRWSASDENGDLLTYRVEIKGRQESTWKLVKENIRERFLTFDSTAFADGEYRVRVTGSDQQDNAAGEELSALLESPEFTIDNSAPQISALSAAVNAGKATVTWKAVDQASALNRVEYSVDGGEWKVALPTTRVLDSREHEFSIALVKSAGEMTVAVRATDDFDNQIVEKVVVR